MPYEVTYMVNEYVWVGWGKRTGNRRVLLDRKLDVNAGVGGCCAVGSVEGFFDDYEFKRHKADHHYVTVRALNNSCQELVQMGCSLAYATINTEQRLSEAALLEAGFVCQTSGWAYRDPDHSRTRTGVKVFIKPLYKVLKRSPK
jgi:hypothetical protein